MASENSDGLEPILAALSTMQANAERSQKSQAHDYLEKFQKSVRTFDAPIQRTQSKLD